MVIEDRTSPATVVFVLTADAALLAMMELFFVTLAVGVVPVPVSALVALVSMPWLVRGAGAVAGPRAAALPLVAWILVIGVLGLAGPGGDVLLLGDWPTLALIICGLVPAAFVLGRVIRANRDARASAGSAPSGASAPSRAEPTGAELNGAEPSGLTGAE
ncbi:MAG TPA: hypothetical protein VNP03_25335 [Pseudonocardia sp.]|nr:hypothetical protein [Pseudonocardia sp.]